MSIGRQAQLREEVRFRVLRLLRQNPEISQRDLAAQVGISHGGAHYVLRTLIDHGLIRLGKVTGTPDRRRHAYRLTPQGRTETARLTEALLCRKRAEYDRLRAEIAALSAELGAPHTDAAARLAAQPGKDAQ